MSIISELLELVATILIGALAALCVSGIIFITIYIYRKYHLYFGSKHKINRKEVEDIRHIPEVMLYKSEDSVLCQSKSDIALPDDQSEVELQSFKINQSLDRIFPDEKWLDGLMPHCLAILKQCRSLTERLTTLSIGILNSGGTRNLQEIVESARCISTKVDDLVDIMCPPLNIQLLEARAINLMSSVARLTVIAKYECRNKNIPLEWIDNSLLEMENHMRVLRDASVITKHRIDSHGSVSTIFRSSKMLEQSC